jgi:hypothetical protein
MRERIVAERRGRGLVRRSLRRQVAKTIHTQRELLQPVVAQIGNTKLRDLTAT